ncbi:MAG: Short-chain dehydrogenase/reductase sdr [uncultured bacterium]|nr:MAG: Short-chain dehydrogenase/reductase sdr [uncultured bacterium]
MQKNIVIFGATSLIAQEIAKLYAKNGDQLFLVGRNLNRLLAITEDLEVRSGKKVNYECCDLTDFDSHQRIIDTAIKQLGHIDIILIAHGTLPNQKACEKNFQYTYDELKTNLISSISLLTLLANYFEGRGKGCLAVLSSVAGDRGRQSNYIYGTAKAGLSVFLQGLRNRLRRSNVNVLTIKPGFVDTPMTQNFKKGFLWAKPDKVAKKIVKSIYQGQQEIYVPWFWCYIMWIIKIIPERVFCKLKL